MNILFDPNVAFVLLVGGFLMTILALFSPGTGILEIGAVFAIVLAGVSVYNLPTNPWALAILILGVIPFIFALRKSRNIIFLAISMLALIIGSIFVFKTEDGSVAIDPLLAIVVSLTSVGFMWLVGTKGLEAIERQPTHDLKQLVGMTGEADTEIFHEGTVYVNGEEWSARSEERIPAGAQIRVNNREGLILYVEKITKKHESSLSDE